MNSIPLSDYPAPADERSQIQTRMERKAELNAQAQQTADSRMDPQAKQAALDGIQERVDAADGEINHLRHTLAAKQKNEAEQRLKKEFETRRRLDVKV